MKKFSGKLRMFDYQYFKKLITTRCSDFLDLFYPRLCVGCGKALLSKESDLCLSCLMQLPIVSGTNVLGNFVEEKFYGRVEIEEASSFLYYEKETLSQELLHHIKYQGGKELGRRLGLMFGRYLQGNKFSSVDAIVPVPLHSNKYKIRGYNQSEWIANGLSEALGKPVWTDVLERSVENATQTRKSAVERWKNVEGIFQVMNHREIKGKHLLIVDDVLTTGATIEACAIPLKEIENVKVSVATLAIVN